jgi:hypothetical protein
MDMKKVEEEISEYNYYSEMVAEKEDELDKIKERIQNAFSQDVIDELEIEKEQLEIEIEELRDKQRELTVNF